METIFSNTKRAFSLKSNFELIRAKYLFKIIENEFLVKIGTAITNFSLKYYFPVDPIIKITVFNHFCGGVSEKDCNPVIKKMYEKHVHSVLDFSTEAFKSENEFNNCLSKKISIIDFIKDRKEIPFAVFKPTCLGKFSLFEKISSKLNLTNEEKNSWDRVRDRFFKICQHAHMNNVRILIDAEEVSVQKAIDDLSFEMMEHFNKDKAIVFNTIQMYRWDRMDYLRDLINKNDKIIFGFKLVRGAYMEKEREIAKKINVKSPICADKPSTDKNFNSAIEFVFNNLSKINVVFGSHNEDSLIKVVELMKNKNINSDDKRIWFGQLYGMSDNITFNLGPMGYNVFKILPFGPVRNLMPYLIRRAEENTSVKGQTGRELQLILNELKRRRLEV